MDNPIKNYTPTSDPNVYKGRHGAIITRADFEHANKNGYAWKDFDAYADYVGSWAHTVTTPVPISPIYRAYGQRENINGVDVAILAAKGNPQINGILTRNVAKQGEVPMFAGQDADIIRTLIAKEKLAAQGSNDNMYRTMLAAKIPQR